MVSNFGTYFGPALSTGYMKNVDTAAGTFDNLYLAKGNPASPILDSASSFGVLKGLSSVPASGTVFRFAPKTTSTTGIGQVAPGSLAKVYPTQCTGILHIDNNNANPLNYIITGMTGQVVAQGWVGKDWRIVDLAGAPAGVYTIRLMDPEEMVYEGQQIVKL